jgi:hypothetical protein
MPQYTESTEIGSPPPRVWERLAEPERWSEGYLATRFRSPDYPKPDPRNDHVYRTRIREDVDVRVIHSEPPTLLEEAQRGRTFSRRVRYRLEPAGERTPSPSRMRSASSGWPGWPPRWLPATCRRAGGARSSGYGNSRSGLAHTLAGARA